MLGNERRGADDVGTGNQAEDNDPDEHSPFFFPPDPEYPMPVDVYMTRLYSIAYPKRRIRDAE